MKLYLYVHQHTLCEETLPLLPVSQQADQITNYIIENSHRDTLRIDTMQELHVLRVLRHVREKVKDLRLNKDDIYIAFDHDTMGYMVENKVTEDGDLLYHVPGGLFTRRSSELF